MAEKIKSIYDSWDEGLGSLEQQTEDRPLVGSFQDANLPLDPTVDINDPALFDAMADMSLNPRGKSSAPTPLNNEEYDKYTLDAILNPSHLLNKVELTESLNPSGNKEIVSPPETITGEGFDTDVAKGKAKATTKIEPLTSAPAPIPSMEDAEMKQALADRKQQLSIAAVLSGVNRMGAGLARTDPTEGFLKDYKQLANLPIEDIKALRTSTKEKMVFDEEKQMNDPTSQASGFQRKAMRDMLNKIGYKSLSDKITDNLSAKQVQSLMGNVNIQNLMTQYEALQGRKELKAMGMEQLKATAKTKMDEQDFRRFDQAAKVLNPDLARNNTALGRNANIIRSSKALKTLVAPYDLNNLTTEQVYEIAKGLDAMLAPGAPTVSGIEKLIPKSARGDLSKINKYISNKPVGAGQGAFVKNLMDSVDREEIQARKNIIQSSKGLLAPLRQAAERHPEEFQGMLIGYELPPDMLNPIKDETQADTAKIKLPDGRTGIIPRKNLQEAIKRGAREIN